MTTTPQTWPAPPPQATDSSEVGYLAPTRLYCDREDLGLRRFLQRWVVGVTNLEQTLVRPRWQPEPPNEPPFEVTWAAVGPESAAYRHPDTFAYEGILPDGNRGIIRHELLDLLFSSYGPDAEEIGERFSLGIQVHQNREHLTRNGYGLVSSEGPRLVPVMRNTRWLTGVDIPFVLRRRQQAAYNVLPLEGATGNLITDVPPTTRPITVSEE